MKATEVCLEKGVIVMGSKKVVILHSGGLDSTLMYELAREEEYDVTAVYFDLGHEYA
jgi:7-cyano-7-deazaguanine synthase in queuosine biosynthesis